MNGLLIFLYNLIFIQTVISEIDKNTVNEYIKDNDGSKELSRRKRFIIFPEGSSVQLVFCNQVSGLIPIGDIFLFGYTAALAWQLPTDPKYTYIFNDLGEAIKRSDHIMNYLDEDGKMISKKRIIANPTFSKRNVDDHQKSSYKEKLKLKLERQKLHERHIGRDYLKAGHGDSDTREFHRTNRLELYKKIEILINALGRDGRQCVLYKLCQTAQLRRGQGTFLQEFLNVVFTLPTKEELNEEIAEEYDAAHTVSDRCMELYPGCFG